MKIRYDDQADALYIALTNNKVVDTDPVTDDIIIDYDDKKEVVGVEILDASQNKEFENIVSKIIESLKRAA